MFRLYDKINNDEVYVIAEMSANHGGSLEHALELVRQAANAGADCLKIQTYTADSITIDCDNESFLINGGLWDGYKLYDLYKEASTPYEWHKDIKEECEKCGIDFLSTPFDCHAVDFLESLEVEAYKIASFELVDIPLIEYVASKGKPIIISCGMGSVQEIQDAIDACHRCGNNNIVLLKCCSEYPANWDDMHLGNITDMRERFGQLVGLSDHSSGSIAAIVGVSLGACVVEKHIKLEGIESADSEFSMTVDEFASMIKEIKIAKRIAKGPIYELTDREKSSTVFRRSIFAVEDISVGDVFNENNIKSIRPSNGISPKYYSNILGNYSTRNIKRGEPISLDDLENTEFLSCKNEYELRKVTIDDMELLLNWANDSLVRKNAFNTKQITYDEHRKWFEKLMVDQSQMQYIFLKNNEPIGQIRFSILEDKAEIGYSISQNNRGCGYGKIMLNLAINKFHVEYPAINTLIAKVKHGNYASSKCFKDCAFKESYYQYELDYNI